MKYFTAFKSDPTSLFLSFILFFSITSISCADTPTDSLNKDSGKYLSFYETENGEQIHWEANFYGEEITSIYKNGKRIPDELVEDYKYKIYNELDEMRFGEKRFSFKMPMITKDDFDFQFNFDELNKELEELQKELPKLNDHFNSEEFKKEMKELGKELKKNKLKIYKFNEENFKEQMEELRKNLKELKIKPEDFNFYFDWKEDDEA